MAIPPKQIGWSSESNLLWQISKQLQQLTQVTSATPSAGVSSIIAGAGISIDQSTGNVTISATGGGGGIVPQVQNPTVAERQNIDIYNGLYLSPRSVGTTNYIPNYYVYNNAAINGSIVIVSTVDSMLRSTDGGITWNAIVPNIYLTSTSCNSIIYVGSNTFVATFTNVILYSNDNGITWKSSVISTNSIISEFSFGTSAPAFLTVGGVPTIVVGANNSIFYSIDLGITFIEINSPTTIPASIVLPTSTNNIYRVNASNGYFFAYSSIARQIFLYSSDGINWNYSGVTFNFIIKDIVYNNSRYFINQSTNNTCYYTTDFNTFTAVTRTVFTDGLNQNAFVANGNVLIAIGTDLMISSNNGTTWTSLFNNSGLTILSSLITQFVGVYGWFDGTRFNILCSTTSQTVLLYDTDGTGTSWSVSPLDISTNNSIPVNVFFGLISPTRYITSIQLATTIGKVLVKDTPLNGSTNIELCQTLATNVGLGFSQGATTNYYYNFKYVNNRFVSPLPFTGYVPISTGSDPTVKWTRTLINTTASSSLSRFVQGLHYANGYWVAVGFGGIISTSPDLVNWTINASTQATAGNNLAIMESIGTIGVIPATNTNVIWTSPNVGTSAFTSNTLAGYGAIGQIATNGTVFVVSNLSALATVAYSSNGTAWTNVNVFGGVSTMINRLIYLNGKFIACHTYGVSVSSDGITWTSPTTTTTGIQMYNCVYTNGYWVALGAGTGGGVVFRSSDSVNWKYLYNSQLLSYVVSNFSSVVSDNTGNIVACSNGSTYPMVSNDSGNTWRAIFPSGAKPASGTVWYATYGNGYFVCSAGSYFYCSNDGGNTWNLYDSQNETIGFLSGGGGVKKVNGKYFTFNSVVTNFTSSFYSGMRVSNSINGTYTKCKTGILPFGAINDISSNGTNYIAVGTGNKVLKSTDGEYFVDVSPKVPLLNTTLNSPIFTFSEYANGIFMVGGANGMVFKSTTGDYNTWTSVTSFDIFYQFTHAAYGNSLWVLAGIGNKVFISPDNGTTWTPQVFNYTTGFTPSFLRFFNGYFYLAGVNRDVIYRSADGINWKMINIYQTALLNQVNCSFHTIERDDVTGYLYLFSVESIYVSTDNGLTFNRTPANPNASGTIGVVNPLNLRQIVENGYLYVSSFNFKSYQSPYQIIGLPIS